MAHRFSIPYEPLHQLPLSQTPLRNPALVDYVGDDDEGGHGHHQKHKESHFSMHYAGTPATNFRQKQCGGMERTLLAWGYSSIGIDITADESGVRQVQGQQSNRLIVRIHAVFIVVSERGEKGEIIFVVDLNICDETGVAERGRRRGFGEFSRRPLLPPGGKHARALPPGLILQ